MSWYEALESGELSIRPSVQRIAQPRRYRAPRYLIRGVEAALRVQALRWSAG